MRAVRIRQWKREIKRAWAGGAAKTAGFSCVLLCACVSFFLLSSKICLHVPQNWERAAALFLWKSWYGVPSGSAAGEADEEFSGWLTRFIMRQVPYYRNAGGNKRRILPGELDPSYRNYLESAALLKEYESLVRELEGSYLMAGGRGSLLPDQTSAAGPAGEGEYGSRENGGEGSSGPGIDAGTDPAKAEQIRLSGAAVAGKALFGENGSIQYLSGQLADYDFLMKHFYTVHPTAAAGRDLMKAKDFLEQDFSLNFPDPVQTDGASEASGNLNRSGTPDDAGDAAPQILIYHTHSQEEFADYSQGNREATIVGVGSYLTELLEKKGYRVYHDTAVYDLRDGTLDRSRAYSYALEGITGILQKYPSIQVVLDIHRDGVKESTHLVTEVNGKKTATIMFFNGTSETPDGPIEYLKNPYRAENLAFSFQMKLCADACYPGFTRKIYLKGLRYNLHLRPRSALIEVGAQNNTYEEARNAMEPLSELLDMVLKGRQ